MHARIAVSLTLGLLLIVGAGCTAPSVLSDAEAEARAETAMQSFAAAMTDRGGDELRSMEGNMTARAVEDDPFGMGDFKGDFEFHWGTGDVVHLIMDVGSGGFSLKVEAWCTPTKMLLKWGNEIMESRPSQDAEHEEMCPSNDEEMSLEAMFSGDDFGGLEPVEVEQLDDGTLRATYHDHEENMTAVALIDTKGRLTHMDMESDEMEGSFDITYGARETITVPEATSRVPATVWSHDSIRTGLLEGNITDSPERPPLAEMELHLVRQDYDSESMDKQRIAGIALSAGSGTDGDYEFTFTDVDNDGRLSENDTFSIRGPDIGEDYSLNAEFYDKWADGYANENPVPGPGLVLTLLGLIGVAFVARRRLQV